MLVVSGFLINTSRPVLCLLSLKASMSKKNSYHQSTKQNCLNRFKICFVCFKGLMTRKVKELVTRRAKRMIRKKTQRKMIKRKTRKTRKKVAKTFFCLSNWFVLKWNFDVLWRNFNFFVQVFTILIIFQNVILGFFFGWQKWKNVGV